MINQNIKLYILLFIFIVNSCSGNFETIESIYIDENNTTYYTNNSNSSVKLFWNSMNGFKRGYKIYRNGMLLKIVDSNNTYYIDNDIQANHQYTYSVSKYEKIYYKNFLYNPIKNLSYIKNNIKIKNLYEITYSTNYKNTVYTYIDNDYKIKMNIYNFDKNNTININHGDYIIFNPVINNNHEYAYALSEYSVSKSKIYLNNHYIKQTEGLYKNLCINNDYLGYVYENLKNGEHFLKWIDLDSNIISSFKFKKGWIQELVFLTSEKILINYFSNDNFSMDIGVFDIAKKEFTVLKNSDLDELINKVNFNKNYTISTIEKKNKNIKLLFNALYNYYNFQLTNPFSNSNNFMGRISWNQSYRLINIVKLWNITHKPIFLININTIIGNILNKVNYKINIAENNYNFKYSLSSIKYSIDKKTPISLLVTDSSIYLSILYALNNSNEKIKSKYSKIIANHINGLYNYYNKFYIEQKALYTFQYGIAYWADGIWLPFNQQNQFGRVLLESYKLTNNNKYKIRAKKLAQRFKYSFQKDDDLILWHYWPNEFYNGWSKDDNISLHTPERKQSLDIKYEDTGHAGINVSFILEYYDLFPEEVFSIKDIKDLNNTIDNFVLNKEFSHYISGKKPISSRFIPKVGWALIDNNKLNQYYISLLPNIYPDFDSQNWDMYLDTIDIKYIKNEELTIDIETYNLNNKIIKHKQKHYTFNNLYRYFELK